MERCRVSAKLFVWAATAHLVMDKGGLVRVAGGSSANQRFGSSGSTAMASPGRWRGLPHPPNSPTTVIATVTHTAAPRVIQMPTLAMSRMEK